MNNAFKRTIAGAVLGTTLAVGGAALAAMPASAAGEWTPTGTAVVPTTPGTPDLFYFRLAYSGAATTVSGATFTVDAPEALEFQPRTASGQNGTAGFVRVTEQYTSEPTYVKCDFVSASQVSCGGPLVDLGGNPVAYDVPLNPGDSLFIAVKNAVIPAGSSGPANQPVTATGSVATALGAQSVPTTTVATVSPATIVDTPVIAPAIAGIALLGAAGVGGGIFAKRRKKATANA